MFTAKFYRESGNMILVSADSFSILRDGEGAEITCHRVQGEDIRYDIRDERTPRPEGWPDVFCRAIIENAMGKTTEIVSLPFPR